MVKNILYFIAALLWMLSEESAALHIKTPLLDVNLEEIGRYSGQTDDGISYQKIYYISKNHKSNWEDAKAICKEFNLDLATFDTLHESKNLLDIPLSDFTNEHVRIDGFLRNSPTEWFYPDGKISYSIPWAKTQPNNQGEGCLSFIKNRKNHYFGFHDYPCWELPAPFVCQKTEK